MMNRRDFLKKTALGIGSIPILNSLTASNLFAGTSTTFSDYKAIVIIQLDGGNDAMNTFIPRATTPNDQYKAARLKISIDETVNLDASNPESNPYLQDAPENPSDIEPQNKLEASYRKGSYHITDGSKKLGINAMMPEFAKLFADKKIAIISNVGTLVEPTTKTQITNKTVKLPIFLYAHDHQRRAIDTAQAANIITTGWLGRLSDEWDISGQSLNMNISYSGISRLMTGQTSSPIALDSGKPLAYTTASNTNITTALNSLSNITDTHLFERLYKRLNLKSSTLSIALKTAWNNAPDFSTFTAKNSYGQTLFNMPSATDIGLNGEIHNLDKKFFDNMSSIAKMIKITKDDLGSKREVFLVKQGGYDAHSGQIQDHSIKLRSLSLALDDFNKTMTEIGLEKEVLVVCTSDFGRTTLSNGDGTDHGWAGHSFIMCGDDSFQGGKILGDVLDDISLDGDNSQGTKGRVIPTTSIEQMLAPAMKWFGVNETQIKTLFPNITNFKTDASLDSAYLQGVFS